MDLSFDESAEQRLLKQEQVLSPLMRAKKRATKGQKVNACPFGCVVGDLDDQGYCRHLIGFTNDGQTLEPMEQVGDRRVVRGAKREPVIKGDQLVRITTSSRVYRDVDVVKKQKSA